MNARRTAATLGMSLLTLAAPACSRGDAASRGDASARVALAGAAERFRTPSGAHAAGARDATPARAAAPAHPSPGATAASAGVTGAAAHDEPGSLRTVLAEAVVGRTGPDGRPFEVALRTPRQGLPQARRFGMKTLGITLRTDAADVEAYPCGSCHEGRSIAAGVDRVADAHQDLAPVHPSGNGAGCTMCHAADRVDSLVLLSGERASLDHAYRLCGQCHFRQADDWAAGAHGKRLDGWQGRRVVMGCAECHDPHDPSTARRIPFRPPQLERARRGER